MSIKNKVTGGLSNISTYDTNGNITALTVSGNLTGGGLTVFGNAVITGNAVIQGNLEYNDVTNLTTANLVLGLGNTQTGVNVDGGGIVVGNTNEASFRYNYATQSWNSNIGIAAAGDISSTNLTTGNITVGNTTASGNITGSYIIGNGAFLTGLPAGYANSNVFSYLANSNVVISTTGNITAANLITGGTVTANGNVSGNYFIGNGAALTGISSSSIFKGTTNIDIPTANGAIAFTVGGTAAGALGANTVSFGSGSAASGQLANAVAIGTIAGASNQLSGAIAIGANAATSSQGAGAVAIGQGSGGLNQAANSIAIGHNARSTNAAVVLNATGSVLNGAAAGLYVDPVRDISATVLASNIANTTTGNVAVYNTVTKEVGYSSSITVPGNIRSGNLSTVGSLSVATTATIGGNITAANLGNISSINLNQSPTQVLYGDGVFKDPISGSMLNITKFDQGAMGGTNLFIAGGRLWAIKGQNNNYTSALGQLNPQVQNGVPNTYEIIFPNETTGTIVDAGSYGYSAFALFANGQLYTWGLNLSGQLGLGNTTNVFKPTLSLSLVQQVYTHPSNMNNDPNYTRLIVRLNNGEFYGCGYNGEGQLGIGNTTNQSSWVQITAIPSTALNVWPLGNYQGSTVVQRADGTIIVCGYNGFGQLGLGNTTDQTSFVLAANWLGGDTTQRIQYISYGGRYATTTTTNMYWIVMFLDNGTTSRLVGAGSNNWGCLGTGNTTNSSVPVAPLTSTGLTGRIAKIRNTGSAPGTMHVRMANGDLFTYGYNAFGQVGNGTTTTTISTPFKLLTGTCADIYNDQQGWFVYGFYSPGAIIQKTDGTYVCCGYNFYGAAGVNSTTSNITTLQQIALPKGSVIKFVGTNNGNQEATCKYIVTADNTIWAWGYNSFFNIADNYNGTTNYLTPVNFVPSALII